MGYFLSFIKKKMGHFFPSRTKIGSFHKAGLSIRIGNKIEMSDTNQIKYSYW